MTGAGGGAPEELIERTETDAAVFLTVYPYTGLEVLNITHYTDLGNQILNCECFTCREFPLLLSSSSSSSSSSFSHLSRESWVQKKETVVHRRDSLFKDMVANMLLTICFLSCAGTENYNRSVFLRWAPEMNGNWMPYGLQPLMFVEVWRTMYTVIKQIAPATAIVWAPNTGQG